MRLRGLTLRELERGGRESPSIEANGYFFSDRKGDSGNVTYGSIHRGDIPTFKAAGRGKILGLPAHFRFVPAVKGGDCTLQISGQDLASRDRQIPSIKNRITDQAIELRLLSRQDSIDEVAININYVGFDTRKVTKRLHGPAPTIPVNVSHGTNLDSSGDEEPDEDEEASRAYSAFKVDQHRLQVIEIEKKLKQNPKNAHLWLEFISLQRPQNDVAQGELTTVTRHSLAKIRTSLYHDALTKVKQDDPEHQKLVLGLMKEGAIFWEQKKQEQEWQRYVQHSKNPKIWLGYLDFEQTTFATFSIDRCKQIYANALNALKEALVTIHRDEVLVHIFLRLTNMLREAGYSELAIALWQTMLQTHLPDDHELSMRTPEAWDREEGRRIGEERLPEGYDHSEEIAPDKLRSPFSLEKWATAEEEFRAMRIMPVRVDDGNSEDDVFSVVMWDDMNIFLFALHNDHAFLLRDAFLQFCGLPATRNENNSFLRRVKFISNDLGPKVDIPTETLVTVNDIPLIDRTMFGKLHKPFGMYRVVEDETFTRFSSVAMQELLSAFPDDEEYAALLVAVWLDIELRMSARSGSYLAYARKLAKKCLKQMPASLRLYDALAMVSLRTEGFEAAEKIWNTILQMCQDWDENDRRCSCFLGQSWVGELLNDGQTDKALKVLLCIPTGHFDATDGKSVMPADVLRARNYFQQQLHRSSTPILNDQYVSNTELLANLIYLTSSSLLESAMQIYSAALSDSGQRSDGSSLCRITLLLHQSRAEVIDRHMRTDKSIYKSKLARELLQESCDLFPNCAVFHELRLQHSNTNDLANRILHQQKQESNKPEEEPGVIAHAYDIYAELRKPAEAGSTQHNVRAAFERAVHPDFLTRHNPEIWSWYIRWEMSLVGGERNAPQSPGSKQRSKAVINCRAKDVYIRAIQACPWDKSIYMLGFSKPALRRQIGFDGLKDVYETMVEKGLRIHVELDENWFSAHCQNFDAE